MSKWEPKTDYIPTTDDVETAFHEYASELETNDPGNFPEAPEFADWIQAMYGFQRWMRQVQEAAWNEGMNAVYNNRDNIEYPTNPYSGPMRIRGKFYNWKERTNG